MEDPTEYEWQLVTIKGKQIIEHNSTPRMGFIKSTTNKMANTVRAKFNVAEITKYGNGGGTKVILMPVISGSEENKSFWQATPAGRIELHISNPDAQFELGEYYIDFTKAD